MLKSVFGFKSEQNNNETIESTEVSLWRRKPHRTSSVETFTTEESLENKSSWYIHDATNTRDLNNWNTFVSCYIRLHVRFCTVTPLLLFLTVRCLISDQNKDRTCWCLSVDALMRFTVQNWIGFCSTLRTAAFQTGFKSEISDIHTLMMAIRINTNCYRSYQRHGEVPAWVTLACANDATSHHVIHESTQNSV